MKKKKERGQEVMLNFLLEYDFEAQLEVGFFSRAFLVRLSPERLS